MAETKEVISTEDMVAKMLRGVKERMSMYWIPRTVNCASVAQK